MTDVGMRAMFGKVTLSVQDRYRLTNEEHSLDTTHREVSYLLVLYYYKERVGAYLRSSFFHHSPSYKYKCPQYRKGRFNLLNYIP